jgi:hypothetical protein
MLKVSVSLLVLAIGLLTMEVARTITAAQSQPTMPCFLVQEKDRLIELSHEAIDKAFAEQVKGLFGIWVRDPSEQPKRAMSGMAINLSAYHRARANIRLWEPVVCP